jgi:hypothetical protein
MAPITLYRPDGEVIEFDSAVVEKIEAGVLTFKQQPDSSTMHANFFRTSLPFLIKEQIQA